MVRNVYKLVQNGSDRAAVICILYSSLFSHILFLTGELMVVWTGQEKKCLVYSGGTLKSI